MTRYSLLLTAGSLVLIAAPAVQATHAATTVKVIAGKPTEFRFALSAKTFKHGRVTFKVSNKGALGHDFSICRKPTKKAANTCASRGTRVISPGKTATFRFRFTKAGTYEYICKVPGHAAAGMKGLVKVT